MRELHLASALGHRGGHTCFEPRNNEGDRGLRFLVCFLSHGLLHKVRMMKSKRRVQRRPCGRTAINDAKNTRLHPAAMIFASWNRSSFT